MTIQQTHFQNIKQTKDLIIQQIQYLIKQQTRYQTIQQTQSGNRLWSVFPLGTSPSSALGLSTEVGT